ncbi:MAG: N-6 DNA methylase, partial [Nanoarchaeota archaeon]
KWLFIEPLLEALGWSKVEVEKEERVLRGRADYILKLGNTGVLVIEAKKTNDNLIGDGKQAVSYAYHSKIKFAVLTNFKYLYVYHALSNIKNIDKNLLKINNNYFRLSFEEYLDKFDWLWLLSKESFEKGDINKLLSAKDERVNKPIDKKLLEDLLKIREWLSKELKQKRNDLEKEKIDECTQILIDRLIFIRSVEDKGLEPTNYLLGLDSDVRTQRVQLQLFPYLLKKFEEFNNKYDSRLFEKGLLEKEGAFSDEILHKTIRALYFGIEDNQAKYMFNEIPGDIFGNIYEQYLGTILSDTEKRIKLDAKSGKRKKMGIYYTPSYIVDYIVKNTVGEYIKDKSIDEILEVKILDPACGSGSFLTRAFQEVCDTIKDKLNNGEEGSKILFKKPKEKLIELNFGQKIEVLRNCIYGVDLDEKAIEIARLNLMLKTLEGVGPEIKKPTLPHLSNIKCGNSLIEDHTIAGDKAFNWHAQFPEVFKQKGFDVVVGNPPYGAELKEKEREGLEKEYKMNNTDTAVLFMKLATELINKNGINGFIVPKPFVYSSTWKKIREELLDGLTEIVDCGKVWKEVLLEQIIYFYSKKEKLNKYNSCVRDNTIIKKIGEIDKSTFNEFGFLLNGISEKELNLGKKIRKLGISLNEFVINQRGAIYQKEITEKKSDLKVLGGAQIGRYSLHSTIKGYISKKIVKDDKALIKPNSILVQRIVAHIENPIDHIKITATLSKDLKISEYIIVDTINQLQNKANEIFSEFLIAIISSKLTNWYAYRFIFGKAIRTMQFDNPVTERIMIPKASEKQKEKIISLVNQMLSLQKKLHEKNLSGGEKERLEQQIKNVDHEIDQEIYKLYEITEDEQKIIEESLK